jgi:ribonuclease HII
MHRALETIRILPSHIIVDGNRFKKFRNIPYTCIIKGDSKYSSIAAASILAKTYRDAFMIKLHNDFPAYQWLKNKGYPTIEHRRAILQHGICIHHRKSFNTNYSQLRFSF